MTHSTQRSLRGLRRLYPLALACGLSAAAGCVSTDGGLSTEDSSTGTLASRISWEPGERAAESDASETRLSFDLDYMYSAAQGEVDLPPGQSIVVGGETWSGTGSTAFIDLERVLFDARLTRPLAADFSIDTFAGFEYTALDLRLVSAGYPYIYNQANESISALGPAVGLGISWQPYGWLRCTSEVRASYGFSSDADEVQVYSLDIGVGWFPWDSFGFYTGWRRLNYAADLSVPNSDISVDLSGAVIGLQIRI